MNELHGDSITARHFYLPKESQDNLASASHALTDLHAHDPNKWDEHSAKTDAALPTLDVIDSTHRAGLNPRDEAVAQRIETLLGAGNADGLQRELQNHNNDELRGALQIVQDDFRYSGLNLTTDWKFGAPVLYIEAEGGHTSVEFNDPTVIGNRAVAGTINGGSRTYEQGSATTPESSDANLGLSRVLNEAQAAALHRQDEFWRQQTENWRKQDNDLARQGHADWHVK